MLCRRIRRGSTDSISRTPIPRREKPQWARGCVGYQIFPDRFRRVDVPGEEAVEPWGSKRVANEYRFGGNLKGILEAVPYLAELGVGVVYMTPIFLSDTSASL